VIHLVASVLPLVALSQIIDGLAAVIAGIMRAQGLQATGALINFVSVLTKRSLQGTHRLSPVISSYYIIGIPIGIYLTFKHDMKLWGLWIGLTIALVCTSITGGLIVLRADWDREVEKVKERLEGERSPGNDDESAESV